jgi:hypothetical protein
VAQVAALRRATGAGEKFMLHGTICAKLLFMRPVRGFFFGYFWFSCAPGGREI